MNGFVFTQPYIAICLFMGTPVFNNVPYLVEYNTHSYMTRTLNFWMKIGINFLPFFLALTKDRKSMPSHKPLCPSIRRFKGWIFAYLLCLESNVEWCDDVPIRSLVKKQRLRIAAIRMSKGCRKIMKEKKRNKNKACWWKNSCITRTLNFWLKVLTKFCALYSNKHGIRKIYFYFDVKKVKIMARWCDQYYTSQCVRYTSTG